ncbi:MAG: hypothetical protein Q7J85_04010 [Bacillota bacterium]|nr:hypothetical protein [Bacillota bacterium]
MFTIENQALALGFLLLLGYFGGELAKKLRIPAVAGYVMAGILLGPSILDAIPDSLHETLQPVKNLGLGMVSLLIGAELVWKKILIPLLLEVFYSILMGIGMGFAAILILKRVNRELEILAILLGLVFLNAGLSSIWELSALLVTMISGIIIANFYEEDAFRVMNFMIPWRVKPSIFWIV